LSPRTGRPRKENAITDRVSVRLDTETLRKLTEYCTQNDVSKGEAVRRALHLLLKEAR